VKLLMTNKYKIKQKLTLRNVSIIIHNISKKIHGKFSEIESGIIDFKLKIEWGTNYEKKSFFKV
jgi:hypothetical protein